MFHQTLKSGCTIEKLQLKEPERLKPALALYMIVAWRSAKDRGNPAGGDRGQGMGIGPDALRSTLTSA